MTLFENYPIEPVNEANVFATMHDSLKYNNLPNIFQFWICCLLVETLTMIMKCMIQYMYIIVLIILFQDSLM